MPLECMFFPDDGNEVRFYSPIKANEKSAIIDFVGRVFVVKCLGHDLGGHVFDIDSSDAIELEPGKVELLEDLVCGEAICPNGRFSTPAVNAKDGQEGTFVIEHDVPFTFNLN